MITPLKVEAFEIPERNGLDRIQAYWCDYLPGRGQVTIVCYGCAWTAYFNAMGDHNIRQFFAHADVGYLVSKMGITPLLKQRARDGAYLARIIAAVKDVLCAAEVVLW